MSESKAAKAEREDAKAKLREWLKPGDTVHTILRHVSRSGMQREIGVVLLKDGADLHPNYLVAKALGERIGKRDGIVVGGCGMDMGFHLVYNLGYVLWPDGFGCIGKGCRSNDHFNEDRDYTLHDSIDEKGGSHPCYCHADPWPADKPSCLHCGCARVAHWHRAGGYALTQQWL